MAGFLDLTKEEKLVCTGEAGSVMDADRLAWEALQSVLGPDPTDAWMLAKIEHAVVERGKLKWTALFVRDPDAPSPPNPQTDVAKITDATGGVQYADPVEEVREEAGS